MITELQSIHENHQTHTLGSLEVVHLGVLSVANSLSWRRNYRQTELNSLFLSQAACINKYYMCPKGFFQSHFIFTLFVWICAFLYPSPCGCTRPNHVFEVSVVFYIAVIAFSHSLSVSVFHQAKGKLPANITACFFLMFTNHSDLLAGK